MSESDVAGLFDRAATAYDRVGPHVFPYYGQRLVEMTDIAPEDAVLDVAAGTGAVLIPAAKMVGPSGLAVGVDISKGMLHEAANEIQRLGLLNARLCLADAERLPLHDATLDAVLCGNSVFFFPDAVHEFHRVLKPGGLAGLTIIAEGCFDWLFEAFRSHAADANEEGAERSVAPAIDSPEGLRYVLDKAGFTSIQVHAEQTDFLYAEEEEFWQTLWTLGFRGTMERMEESALQGLKADISRTLQAFKKQDGIHILFRTLIAFGRKGLHSD
jgi:ubiquinone/menaquinone biosynthesis C-methylase UbiE